MVDRKIKRKDPVVRIKGNFFVLLVFFLFFVTLVLHNCLRLSATAEPNHRLPHHHSGSKLFQSKWSSRKKKKNQPKRGRSLAKTRRGKRRRRKNNNQADTLTSLTMLPC
jgi:hypothetical protein